MRKKPKTRAQLKSEGTELEGVIVAPWFKENCDGCSAKMFKRFHLITELTSGCYIHDAEYTFIPLAMPMKSKAAKAARKAADKTLLRNCKTIVGARGKHPIRRFWLSRAVYYAVRIFAAKGVTTVAKKYYRMPRTDDQFEEFANMVHYAFPDSTEFVQGSLKKVYETYVAPS